MNRQRRGAFTLVELLVVMAIIGILLAMSLPAIQSAREAAHRSQCTGNLQRLILAVNSYENSQAYYPAGVTDAAGPVRSRPQGLHHNWIAVLLPYLDERVAFGKIDFATSVYDKKNAEVAAVQLPELLCPDDDEQRPHSSYAACHHDVEAPIDADNHGTFFLNSRLRPSDITDGLAYTLFLAEKRSEPEQAELGWLSGTRATLRNTGTRLNGTAVQWATTIAPAPVANGAEPGGPAPNANGLPPGPGSPGPLSPPSGPPPTADGAAPAAVAAPVRPPPAMKPTYVGGFGSQHADGLVMAALGDGSVRALSERIDTRVLGRLGNRADGQLIDLSELSP